MKPVPYFYDWVPIYNHRHIIDLDESKNAIRLFQLNIERPHIYVMSRLFRHDDTIKKNIVRHKSGRWLITVRVWNKIFSKRLSKKVLRTQSPSSDAYPLMDVSDHIFRFFRFLQCVSSYIICASFMPVHCVSKPWQFFSSDSSSAFYFDFNYELYILVFFISRNVP